MSDGVPGRIHRFGGGDSAATVLGVVVGLVVGYAVLGPVPTPPPIPILWSTSNDCGQCGVAANANDVFRLIVDNETEFGNTNYTILANNLTSGAVAWPATVAFIKQDFGQYQGTFGEIAPFFASNNTLSLVVAGTGEWTRGQATPVNFPDFTVIVLQWSTATGDFLRAQNYSLGEPVGLTYVAATQASGWLIVDELGSTPYTNVSIETFPELTPGTSFGRWSVNVTIPAYNWTGWPLLPMATGAGLLSLTVMQSNGTTFLLSELTGTVEWRGLTPSLYSGTSSLGTVGYFNDLARSGTGLFYIGENGSEQELERFDLLSHSVTSLVPDLHYSSTAFGSTELESEANGDLIVTNAWDGTYTAFSTNGEVLWNDTTSISPTSVPASGGLSALAYQPIEVDNGFLLTALFQDEAWANGPTGSSYTFSFTSPFQLLNRSSGAVVWQTSYSASFTLGSPGPSTSAMLYLPVATEGSDMIFLYGNSIGVAALPE